MKDTMADAHNWMKDTEQWRRHRRKQRLTEWCLSMGGEREERELSTYMHTYIHTYIHTELHTSIHPCILERGDGWIVRAQRAGRKKTKPPATTNTLHDKAKEYVLYIWQQDTSETYWSCVCFSISTVLTLLQSASCQSKGAKMDPNIHVYIWRGPVGHPRHSTVRTLCIYAYVHM